MYQVKYRVVFLNTVYL